jgi:AraC-like DNA-binding protein
VSPTCEQLAALAVTRSAVTRSRADARHPAAEGRVRVYVEEAPVASVPALFEPVLYVVLQGAKQLVLGDRSISYEAGQLVVVGLDLPVLAHVERASPDVPYVAVEIPLDMAALTEMLQYVPPEPRDTTADAVSVHPTPPGLLEPLGRLLDMIGDPIRLRLLGDGVVREIAFHAVMSEHGHALRELVRTDSSMAGVGRVTRWMRAHLHAPVDLAGLAGVADMSVSSMQRHFKAQTGLSPIAYHKQLRLHEARRLGVEGRNGVSQIAASVGYVSAAHFSRDYKDLFGVSPSADFRSFGASTATARQSA